MSIAAREDQLLDRWKTGRSGFVRDGAADEAAFLASEPRTVFILKEVNDRGGGGWDLREFMRQGARRQTWDNITRWTLAARRPTHRFEWSEIASVSPDLRAEVLRTVCAINLKKTPGSHTSVTSEVSAAAASDAMLLREQLELYSPQLIICCGTGDSVAAMSHRLSPTAWRTTSRGVRYQPYGSHGVCVHYLHPEARVPDNLLFYGLADAIRELAFGFTATPLRTDG